MDGPPMRTFQFDLPMRIPINRRGEVESLNLNVYRNLHFYKLSAIKKNFHKLVVPMVKSLPRMDAIHLHYRVFPRTKGRLDTMNVGSIVDKFFSDVLVEAGVIEDDDYTRVVFNSFEFGAVCKDNPHVEVTITEINTTKKEEQPMRILLDENDIQTALSNYVEELGISGATGVELRIENNVIVAEVMTGPVTTGAVKPAPKPRNKGGRPAGSKNKPVEETTDVAKPGETGGDVDGPGASKLPDQSIEEIVDAISGPEASAKEAPAESGNSKNLFEESPEESSKAPAETAEAGTAEVKAPAKKKSSIFDA
jgi:hypothetical protein